MNFKLLGDKIEQFSNGNENAFSFQIVFLLLLLWFLVVFFFAKAQHHHIPGAVTDCGDKTTLTELLL